MNSYKKTIRVCRYVIGIAMMQWFFILLILGFMGYSYYDSLNLFTGYKKVSNSLDIERYYNNYNRIISFKTELIKTDFQTFDGDTERVKKNYYLAKLDDCYIPMGIWSTSKEELSNPYMVWGKIVRKSKMPKDLIKELSKYNNEKGLELPVIPYEITTFNVFEQQIDITVLFCLTIPFLIVAIIKIKKHWYEYIE